MRGECEEECGDWHDAECRERERDVECHRTVFRCECDADEAYAVHCAGDGRYDFWLTAAPLPVTGAVGSPVNPIAVK